MTVNHSGDITVLGDGSRAVVAESINGGGGDVVLDFNGVATLPGVPDEIYDSIPLPSGIEESSTLVFFGGGHNQGDSNAGKVTLNLTRHLWRGRQERRGQLRAGRGWRRRHLRSHAGAA